MEEIQYVIELGRNKTEEAFSIKGCANIKFLGFYVCMFCLLSQTENFRTKKKLQNKLYPKNSGKSIVLKKFTHPGPY